MSYTTGMPTSTQTFAQTQPLIQNNFDTINTDFGVDHVAFTAANAGRHKQMQFLQAATPAASTGTESVMYPGNFAGTSYATQIGPFFQNASTTLLCGINAFVRFVGATGSVTSKYGVFTVSRTAVGDYTITWGTNAGAVVLPSDNYAIFITAPGSYATDFTIAADTLRFKTRLEGTITPSDPTSVNVLVMGA